MTVDDVPVPGEHAGPATSTAQAPTVTVAVVQFSAGTDPTENLAALRAPVTRAAADGARVVVAPEYSSYGVSRMDERVVAAGEPLTGPFVTGLAALARETGVYLVAGTIESVPDDPGRIRNTLVVLDPAGELIARYRKVHLYDAFGLLESDIVEAGEIEAPATFTVDGVIFGMQTCFDLRFPEGFRRSAAAGAHVLLVPAQWIPGPGKVDQWTTLARARAIENTTYLVAADQAAPRGSGASMIVDPAGQVLAALGDESGVILADIDPDRLARVRAANPSLALRRFTVTARAETAAE